MIENDNTRLDQFVKESLNRNDIPFNESDWADMEKRLNSRPVSVNPFRKWSFSMNSLLIIAALGSASVVTVYSFSGNKNQAAKDQDKTQEQVVKTNTPVQQPVTNTANENTNTGTAADNSANTSTINPLIITNTQFSVSSNTQQNNTLGTGTNNQKVPDKMSPSDKNALFGNPIDDGNQTLIFPDMIDPKDGIIRTTQEPDCTKINRSIGDENYKMEMNDSSSNGGDSKDVNSSNATNDDGKTDKPKKKKKKSDPSVDTTKQNDSSAPSDSTQTDAKKRNKNDKPKYKNKKDPNDPYSD